MEEVWFVILVFYLVKARSVMKLLGKYHIWASCLGSSDLSFAPLQQSQDTDIVCNIANFVTKRYLLSAYYIFWNYFRCFTILLIHTILHE